MTQDTESIKENADWNRHYDNLMWIVTTIFATAIGGLLVYVHSNFDVLFAVFGLLITLVAVYFAASFRQLRFKHPPNQNKSKHPQQWSIYVAIFVGLEFLWEYLLVLHKKDSIEVLFWVGLIIPWIAIIYLWHLGWKPKTTDTKSMSDNTRNREKEDNGSNKPNS